jgi:hypothetical protein
MKSVWYHNLEHVMAVAIILSWLLIFFVQRRYIMRRYEEETQLSKLVFFSNPVFDSFSGAFFRHLFAGFYTLHLFSVWLMPDALRRRVPTYRDVTDRDQVLRHFSTGELVLSVVIGFMVSLGMTLVFVLFAVKIASKLSR